LLVVVMVIIFMFYEESMRDESRETFESVPYYVPHPLRQVIRERAHFFWTQSAWSKVPYAISSRMFFTKWNSITGRIEKTYRKMKHPEAILGVYTGGALVAYILQHIIISRYGAFVPVYLVDVRSNPVPNNCVEKHVNGHSKYFDTESIANVQNIVHNKSVMLVDDSVFNGTTLCICKELFPSIDQIMIFSKNPFTCSTFGGVRVQVCSPLTYIPFDIAPV
jgi:adenine/guanine phosphoribosyltransferase-like PRPP-binding protein